MKTLAASYLLEHSIIWRDIPGYEGLYQVSHTGLVFSFYTNKLLKFGNCLGYSHVQLCRNKKKKNLKVHRLVMMAFTGPSSLPVNHRDGNKTNNHISNLEYVTSKQNIDHSHANGLARILKGEEVGSSKLTKKKVIEIKRLLKEGKTLKFIADKYKVSDTAISHIKTKKSWRHI